MFCRFCGKQILEDSEFCVHCGKMVKTSNATKADDATKDISSNSLVCDLCGKTATKFYDLRMYRVIDRSYAPPFGVKFKYEKRIFKIPCCDKCHKSVECRDTVFGVFGLIVWIVISGLFLFLSPGRNNISDFILMGFLALPFSAILCYPFHYFFSGERTVCHNSKRAKKLSEEGWILGDKPTKADY